MLPAPVDERCEFRSSAWIELGAPQVAEDPVSPRRQGQPELVCYTRSSKIRQSGCRLRSLDVWMSPCAATAG